MATEHEIRALVRQVLAEMAGEAPSSAPSAEAAGTRGAVGAAARVAVGADHGGFALKETLAAFLGELGYDAVDCGTTGTGSVDYPDFAHEVARRVASGECRWGIVVDGAGIGSCMTANKVPGVRAALCYDLSSARNSREHNLANVLTLGAGLIGEGLAKQIVRTWLETPWGAGRHERRVEKITAVERRYLKNP